MSRINKPALLVGSVPAKNVEQVFQSCAEHGGDIFDALPDGEIGERSYWVTFLFFSVYDSNPNIETVQRPVVKSGKPDWLPAGYDDNWSFKLADGVSDLRHEKLGYAEQAENSYATFRRLKDAGTVAADTRFQVALPTTESSFRWVFHDAAEHDVLVSAFYDVMAREMEAIVAAIPASELSIQWDVCWETVEIEAEERDVDLGLSGYQPPGKAFDRYVADITKLALLVPEDALMGLHLCYGDLGHRHCIEPQDLSVVVNMANAAATHVARSIDFVHVPVPRSRHDAEYFAPLSDYKVPGLKLFLGLVHVTDGLAGTMQRVEAGKRYFDGFGIATECGFGRRPVEQIPEILGIHREVAETL